MDLKQTKALLETFQIRPTHSLGQNFLVDEAAVERICDLASLTRDDTVLEIGPGLGHLTVGLSSRSDKVIAIEIDRHILPALQHHLEPCHNVSVIHADALTLNFRELLSDIAAHGKPLKVVANLPYYVTTELLVKLLVEVPFCNGLWLMMQKEAADRIAALPGSKEYGPAGVLARSLGDIRRVLSVGRGSFYPQPHIDSAILQIIPAAPADRLILPEHVLIYADFIKACFAQRRKTLANSYQTPPSLARLSDQRLKISDVLENLGIRRDIRAEALTAAQFVRLFHSILEN